MPIQIAGVAKYKCMYCGSEHMSYDAALDCELHGPSFDFASHKIGDTLSFEVETNLGGVRWSYRKVHADIIFKFMSYDSSINAHRTIYVVGYDGQERFVFMGESSFGTCLIAPSDLIYRTGFVDSVLKAEYSDLFTDLC